MAKTERVQRKSAAKKDSVETTKSAEAKEKGDELKDEIDKLLDEIDSVLETNAEAFVAQYVQKGGQ